MSSLIPFLDESEAFQQEDVIRARTMVITTLTQSTGITQSLFPILDYGKLEQSDFGFWGSGYES